MQHCVKYEKIEKLGLPTRTALCLPDRKQSYPVDGYEFTKW